MHYTLLKASLIFLLFQECASQSTRRWLTNESGDLFYCQNGCLGEKICVSKCPQGSHCEDIWLGFKACRNSRRRIKDNLNVTVGENEENEEATVDSVTITDSTSNSTSITFNPITTLENMESVEETTEATPTPPASKPQVNVFMSVLSEGKARQIGRGRYNLPASITLIIDGDRNILVDTGTPTDTSQKEKLITGLDNLNLTASSINFVIITHGHPEHFGQSGLFPNALHYFGTFLNHGKTFAFNELFNADSVTLTPNVKLLRTPGHTPEDISVVVDNIPIHGTVAVVGDLFMARQDMDFPDMWEPLAWDTQVQETNRRMILCKVDAIVPGHGALFEVTDVLRERFKCDSLDKKQPESPIRRLFSV